MEDVGGQPISSSRGKPFRSSEVLFTLGNKRGSMGHRDQDVLGINGNGYAHGDQPKAEVVTYLT